MFIRFIVSDQIIALFIETVRFVLGSRDHGEDVFGLAEDRVHLLQGAIGGFGVEEVYHGEDECVTVRGWLE